MKEEDILTRQSRPQRYSTFVPRNRDWRYATGVFRHDDFQDAPKEKSTWDTMDYEYAAGGDGKDGNSSATSVDTPESKSLRQRTESPCVEAQVRTANKVSSSQNSVWASVTRFTASCQEVDHDGTSSYKALRHVLSQADSLPLLSTPISDPPLAILTPKSLPRSQALDSNGQIRTFPIFQRAWVDETRPFNTASICSTLRAPSDPTPDLGAKYNWYPDAVHISAIFPPGIPLSAKEIHAFYPHHVRWKGVMVRLAKNEYRGGDIVGMQAFFRGPPTHIITASQMSTYQRDAVKSTLPSFKTVGYQGKPDRSLYTDTLSRGKYIDDTWKNYTLPTFNDLLRGLQNLPSGLDARGLTQCLSWYLSNRDAFSPPLELNVLHTRDLIHALRLPLRGFGPQNLDRGALREWREKETFEKVIVRFEKKTTIAEVGNKKNEKLGRKKRTQLHMNMDDDSVALDLTLPLRHVLTFPFLALHSVVGEAFRMGTGKAEARKRRREEDTAPLSTQGEETVKLVNGISAKSNGKRKATPTTQPQATNQNPEQEETTKSTPYRILKRPRPVAENSSDYPPTLSKRPAPTPHSHLSFSSYPHGDSHSYSHSTSQPPSGPRSHQESHGQTQSVYQSGRHYDRHNDHGRGPAREYGYGRREYAGSDGYGYAGGYRYRDWR